MNSRTPACANEGGKEGATASPAGSGAPTTPAWNPFDDDGFSNFTAEELVKKDKQADGKVTNCACARNQIYCVCVCVCRGNFVIYVLSDAPGETEKAPTEDLIPGLLSTSPDQTVPQTAGEPPLSPSISTAPPGLCVYTLLTHA